MTRSETDWAARLADGAAAVLGRALDRREVERFSRYLALLQAWQRVHRLVGSVDPTWIVDRVFLDSLAFVTALPRGAKDVLDLGSGAGVPGIPMRIVSVALRLTIVEARARRVSFLRTVIRELSLSNTVVVGARAETVGEGLHKRFDAVVVRCAGRVSDVVGLSEEFVRPGGAVIVGGRPAGEVPVGAERVIVRGGSRTGRHLFVFRPGGERQQDDAE